ncbi:MAG: hypothetical protein NTW04_05165 [Elusimicrobia bacterium]|nr:hypothetical protein [Elusimicrobiota bacterium]
MNRNLFFISCLFFCASALSYELPKEEDKPHIYFEADESQYKRQEDLLYLKGNVKVVEKNRGEGLLDRTLRGEEIFVYISSKTAVSPGAAVAEEGVNALYGERAVLAWGEKSLSLEHVTSSYDGWKIIDAEKGSIKGKKHKYKNVKLTSCFEENPHYYIKLGSMTITPKRKLWGTNAVFYIKKVPVFYLPVIYRPLGTDKDYITYISVGYDDRNGVGLKTTTVYHFNQNAIGKFLADYYTKSRFGAGLEFIYDRAHDFKSRFSGYVIPEPQTSFTRWGLNGGYWQKLAGEEGRATYFAQAQFRLMSDKYFNNDYFRSNPYAVSPDRNMSAAVVRQTPKTTSRVSYQRIDSAPEVKNIFVKALETRPRLDFSAAPFGVYLPLLNTVTAYYDASETSGISYFNKTAGAQWTMFKAIPVVKNISLLPSAFYRQNVTFSSPLNDNDMWVGRYGTGLNLRFDTLLGSLDLLHSFVRRLEPNNFTADTNAQDRGTETNSLAAQTFFRPNRLAYFKLASSYDFRRLRGLSRDFEDRLGPIIADAAYTPSATFNLFAQDVYRIGGGNEAFVLQADIGRREGNSLGFGLANYSSSPRSYIISQSASWRPKAGTWGFEAGLSTQADMEGFRVETLRSFLKTLTIYKNFHDFETIWRVRFRPGVREFIFSANLKFDHSKKRVRSEKEAEKFPWRKEGQARDD